MPQRDDTIEAIKRLDALLEYAVMHIRLRRRRQVARRSVATAPHSVAPTQQVPRGHVRAT